MFFLCLTELCGSPRGQAQKTLSAAALMADLSPKVLSVHTENT